MKHYINIKFPITEEFIHDYTIDTDNIITTEKSSYITISNDLYNQYKDENKIYYMHDFNSKFVVSNTLIEKHVYPVIFIKTNDQYSEYHICQVSDIIEEQVYLTDITYRIQTDRYWINVYTPSPVRPNFKLPILNDKLVDTCDNVYFYDTKSEAIKGYIEYIKKYVTTQSKLSSTIYTILNTDYTYEREFNKLYEERINNLRKEITDELMELKTAAFAEITEYNSILQKLTEIENNL